MINKQGLVLVLLFLCINVFAQDKEEYNRAKNGISIEAGGGGVILSINYDRVLLKKEKMFLDGKIGFGTYLLGVSVPHSVTANFGKKSHLEVGIGGTLLQGSGGSGLISDDGTHYWAYPILGYRLHPAKGFLFKIAFTPLIGKDTEYNNETQEYEEKTKLFPWGGLSLGYCF